MMINTVDDDSGEAANMLTKAETGMFFDLVEALLDNEGQILKNDALDCGRDHRMTPTDAELALSRMERMKWFKTVKTGPEEEATLVFGPRAIGELPHVRNFTRNLAINRPNNVANGGGNHHNRGGGNVNVVIDDDDDEAEEDASYPVGNTKGDDNDDDEEEEEVVVARSARRSMLPRMSQDRELREVDNDEDEEVEDADEDEDVVQEVQQARHSRGSRSSSYRSGSQQSQRMTRSRSSRSRSSQYD